MLKIYDNDISFTKGDTVRLTMQLYSHNKKMDIGTKDIITFSVKKKYSDKDYVIHKKFIGTANIILLPQDSSTIAVGDYVYDIEIKFENGSVYTPSIGNLHITNEVTADEQ